MSENQTKTPSRVPIYVAIGILVVFAGVFLLEFIQLSQGGEQINSEEDLTAETYMDEVEPLLVEADPANGRELLTTIGCNACHEASQGRLAPGHDELAALAAERRPPLTAAAYIYESILYPGAYVVEGYQNNMPRIYEDRLSDQELGDIMAYLLLTETEKEALN